jgi:hypothetical protein
MWFFTGTDSDQLNLQQHQENVCRLEPLPAAFKAT